MSSSQRGRTAERPPPRAEDAAGRVPASRPESSLGNHLELDHRIDARSDLATAQEHVAAGEELARLGCWEDAYQRLRSAVDLLAGLDPAERPQSTHAELDRLRREHELVREQARRDFLTASYNRRYLDDRLATLLDDPAVLRSGMALAMVDIDHFKKVNDRYGHPFGDRVLQRVVAELDAALPEGAFCARYGGEEFALVLPGFDPAKAVEVCERARTRIDRHGWLELDPALRVTVSVGVAHSVSQPPDVEQLLVGADVLLYAAKGAGRNAVAFRRANGRVALAGPAGARRDIPQPSTLD
ncbi:MAG TPA: GGDEF domain-containing protein [Pseudonocardia sp.]|jgi:diguanylate cyclase (GGDEF)-like protein|uniref:GGDEF domain-containing protein n=1 Tax=Pseudonocardia sp. TaxID=60912 RepID=UPI002F4277B5